jgi:hypothetical protein
MFKQLRSLFTHAAPEPMLKQPLLGWYWIDSHNVIRICFANNEPLWCTPRQVFEKTREEIDAWRSLISDLGELAGWSNTESYDYVRVQENYVAISIKEKVIASHHEEITSKAMALIAAYMNWDSDSVPVLELLPGDPHYIPEMFARYEYRWHPVWH